jgi:hypothetical protein
VTTIDTAPAPAVPPPPPARSRAGAVMIAVAAVFVVVAIVLVIVGVNAQSDASHDDDRTAALTAARDASAKVQRPIDQHKEHLRKLSNAVMAKWSALGAALNDMVMAQNHFIDVVNHAADLYNGGDHAGAAAAVRTDGAPALTAMVQKNTAVQGAYQAARTALQQLQDAS